MCIRDRHYPEVEREVVWEQVQLRYAELLSKWRTDLGGKKNFHNGTGGTYDCIAIMCFYDVCRDVTTFREIEEIEENLILPAFRKLHFVDANKPFWKKLMYLSLIHIYILQSLCTVIVGSLGEAVHISFGHFRLSGQDALL